MSESSVVPMPVAAPTLPPGVKLPRFRPNGAAQARALFIRRKIKLVHGGLGSGKSVLHPYRYIQAAQRGDTDQLHALFTHTVTQFTSGILPNMEKRLKRCGISLEYDHEPPPSWFRYWEKARTAIPHLQKFRGIVTLFPIGIFIQHGTFHHQSFTQFHSVDFRTIAIDECFDATEPAVRDIAARCRCGDADERDDDDEGADDFDLDADPHCGHLHEIEMYGNPPLGRHWIFQWLDRYERAAEKYHDGSPVDHLNWDLLRRGVGRMVMIRVSTRDNLRNMGRDYIEDLEAGFSNDVAARYIDGEIVREAAGRAFVDFTTAKNVSPVEYDPERPLYVWLDFDLAPRAGVFIQKLERGEYPDQGDRDVGLLHFGVFGEFFNEGEMSDQEFILALIRGGRGIGGDGEYPDPVLRGLPREWDGIRSHRGRVIFSGDTRGKDKSRHNPKLSSDWQIVRDVAGQELGDSVKWTVSLLEKNPDPSIRIHTTNSRFCSISGVRQIHLDPRVIHLRRDAEVCEWDEEGHDLRHCGRGFGGGTLWMRTHLIAALGYGICKEAPMGIENIKGNTPKVVRRQREVPPSYI